MISDIEEKYSVGPLMYSPAINKKAADTIIYGNIKGKYSFALCLEDTISEDMVEEAENQLKETFERIYCFYKNQNGFVPKIFIRVREAEQMKRVFNSIRDYTDILSGFIFPKYTVVNADNYNSALIDINKISGKKIYGMPIIESSDIIDLKTRYEILEKIKKYIDSINDFVINVRVGGNDFSNAFGVRRHNDETIYDIFPIAQLLSDIITFFSMDYVVSGPVWEFFYDKDGQWERGLKKEIKLDMLNGFVGKTVIHPNQIPVVNEMLKVSVRDYEDAKEILNWNKTGIQVGKSFGGERMNEVRTNYNWALKTMVLAKIYGILQKE